MRMWCARLPRQTADSTNCLHPTREAMRNGASRSVHAKRAWTSQNSYKSNASLLIRRFTFFTRCETNIWITFDARPINADELSLATRLMPRVLIRESCVETRRTAVESRRYLVLRFASCKPCGLTRWEHFTFSFCIVSPSPTITFCRNR